MACTEWKAEGEFYRTSSYCKPCHNQGAWRLRRPRRVMTKEEKKASRRAYYRRNRERILATHERGRRRRGVRKMAPKFHAKAFILERLGPCCGLCRFAGWPQALQVHHLIPELKHPNLRKKSWRMADLPKKALEKELETCCLLCANCHAGVEAGHLCLETAGILGSAADQKRALATSQALQAQDL